MKYTDDFWGVGSNESDNTKKQDINTKEQNMIKRVRPLINFLEIRHNGNEITAIGLRPDISSKDLIDIGVISTRKKLVKELDFFNDHRDIFRSAVEKIQRESYL